MQPQPDGSAATFYADSARLISPATLAPPTCQHLPVPDKRVTRWCLTSVTDLDANRVSFEHATMDQAAGPLLPTCCRDGTGASCSATSLTPQERWTNRHLTHIKYAGAFVVERSYSNRPLVPGETCTVQPCKSATVNARSGFNVVETKRLVMSK